MLRLLALSAIVLTLSACSAITSISDDQIPCTTSAEQPNPCPSGFLCVDQVCRAGGFDAGPDVPRPDSGCAVDELCNGIDDDCDDIIDETHDVDGDGVTWCGGGRLEYGDCNDNNPDVRPAVPGPDISIEAGVEECNGVDEDCDGMIDETAVCPGGTVCREARCAAPTDCTLTSVSCEAADFCDTSTMPPSCQSGRCTSTEEDCVGAEICDPVTGGCVVPLGLGSPCTVDAQCANGGICVESAAAGLASAPAKICATTCCNDDSCPASALCHASGTGARLCIPADMLGITRGGGTHGDSCSADSNCDSGRCNCNPAPCSCLETCSNEADCGGSRTCTTLPYVGPDGSPVEYVNGCDTPVGSGQRSSWCFDGSDCRSGACWTGLALDNFCGGPCGHSGDCGVSYAYCAYYAFPSESAQVVARCRPNDHRGTGTTGTACGSDSECRDLRCSLGECADSCCSDAHCPGGDTFRCRPISGGGGRFPMHCVKS